MFKGKNFDNFLKASVYIFSLLAFVSIVIAIYNKYMGYSEHIEIGSTCTFIFFAFFAKYQYAIQFWLEKLEKINTAQRNKQLLRELEEK